MTIDTSTLGMDCDLRSRVSLFIIESSLKGFSQSYSVIRFCNRRAKFVMFSSKDGDRLILRLFSEKCKLRRQPLNHAHL